MFTGIIEDLGKIERIHKSEGGLRLHIVSTQLSPNREPGSSISVNGACLTVVDVEGDCMDFDISEETLHRTTLGKLAVGDRVNLESPLKAGGGFEGHIVQGHIDGTGEVVDIKRSGEHHLFIIEIPSDMTRYVVEKGSIAVDGISLTVASIDDSRCEFAIIPHTCRNTNLQFLKAGSPVNIEIDILAKYVENLLSSGGEGTTITREMLSEYGFIR